ncbi:MAG: peptidylprolyl isomerase [Candidatus Kapabacteria bacterium]|nr:peptidylprolyl isomerase [Candidatus Kapabacteria bacterium]
MKKILLLILIPFMLSCVTAISADAPSTGKNPQYKITVTQLGKVMGEIILETWPEVAPKHAHNFDSLVSVKFYDGCAFHRVISGFMIQGGDPNSKTEDKSKWGYGAPGQTRVPAEFSQTLSHERGILSAARSNDPNSATSQFFLMHQHNPSLDKQYSIYGKIISGIEIVDKITEVPLGGSAGSAPNDKVEMKIVKLK